MAGGTIFGSEFFGQGQFQPAADIVVSVDAKGSAKASATLDSHAASPSEGGIGTGGGGGWSGPQTREWVSRWTARVEASGGTSASGALGITQRIVLPRLKRPAKVRATSGTSAFSALHVTHRHTAVVGAEIHRLGADSRVRIFAEHPTRTGMDADGRRVKVYNESGAWQDEENMILSMALSLVDE